MTWKKVVGFWLGSWFALQVLPAQPTGQEKIELLNQLLQSLPSPLEISSIIKEEGVAFAPDLLATPWQAANSQAISEYQAAIHLGVFSGALGYVNLYEGTDSLSQVYLESIVATATRLNLQNQIDFVKIAQYAFNNNLNGLLAETANSFEKMNTQLLNQNKEHLSVLILTGGWIETLYLTCQAARLKPTKILEDRIAEQKLVLNQLLPLFDAYRSGGEMETLYLNLKKLENLFQDIRIRQKARSNEDFVIEKMGNLEVIIYGRFDNQKGNTRYKEEELLLIITETEAIRKQVAL
ncbi:MAG: hypothetical protein OHK0053_10230 [Microscillaceae bacterium]